MKKSKKNSPWKIILPVFLILLITSSAANAAVSVFAEGAYNNTDLVIYIYANTGSDTLRSFGLKLFYDNSKIQSPIVQRGSKWALGSNTAYATPDISTPGEVLVVGGVLDEVNPEAGISGARVLLFSVKFMRLESADPNIEEHDYFGISLEEGHESPYANFVDADSGLVIDGSIIYSFKIREAGDANCDRSFTMGDLGLINTNRLNGTYAVFSDCNQDGTITMGDIGCANTKRLTP